MKIIRQNYLLVLPLLLFVWQPLLAEPKINLSGRKDSVLKMETRQIVLEVAQQHLGEKGDEYLHQVAEVKSPYGFEGDVGTVSKDSKVEEKKEEVLISYDDASVLKVIARNLASQVRGTLTRGTTSFLQLKGGSMIKPGTSFPVTIPEAQDQTFTVTVIDVTSSQYTLQLGEATLEVSLDAAETTAIRRD